MSAGAYVQKQGKDNHYHHLVGNDNGPGKQGIRAFTDTITTMKGRGYFLNLPEEQTVEKDLKTNQTYTQISTPPLKSFLRADCVPSIDLGSFHYGRARKE